LAAADVASEEGKERRWSSSGKLIDTTGTQAGGRGGKRKRLLIGGVEEKRKGRSARTYFAVDGGRSPGRFWLTKKREERQSTFSLQFCKRRGKKNRNFVLKCGKEKKERKNAGDFRYYIQ